MTVMIERYFGIPQSAVRLGKVRSLSGAATKLYLVLWHESERYQTRELTRTTRQLRDLMGGARNTHAKAREELIEAGLLEAEPYGTEGFVFHLCNPDTGRPWAIDPKVAVPYRKKNDALSEMAPISPAKSGKPPKIANAGTNFPLPSRIVCPNGASSRLELASRTFQGS